jgi:hypothetical protein
VDDDEAVTAELTEADMAIMNDGARCTRVVRMSIGNRSYRLGSVEIEPHESMLEGIVLLLRGFADRLEQMGLGS